MAAPYILFALVASVFLCPFAFRVAGWFIRHRTSSRRELLLSRARDSVSQDVTNPVDDDWEQVDAVVGTAPNGEKPDKDWNGVVGFFHPFWYFCPPEEMRRRANLTVYSNAGGGGERVLWAAIKATQQRWPGATCVVYTGDHDTSKEAIIKRVQDRFNIQLHPQTLHFLYLSTRKYVLASTWPHFTLLGQSLGSLLLALDAFRFLVPDIFIDTMGYAFTLYLSKLLFPNVPTGAYVHYPTISTDMLDSLDSENETHGVNAGAGKGLKGALKRKYWHLFAACYSHVGASVDVVMTNSSWTQQHIRSLWGAARKRSRWRLPSSSDSADDISVVFPPVAVSELERQVDVSATSESNRQPNLLYIAQFRPEKNHSLILHAFANFLSTLKASSQPKQAPKLILVGSVRDPSDSTRVYKLRLLAHELQIKDSVEFVCDATWSTVLNYLRTSSVGVNGMWNEHFGIGVVEYQASGLVSVVNGSGGPRMDIVIDVDDGATGKDSPFSAFRENGVVGMANEATGFLASTVEEYAAAFEKALSMSPEDTVAMRLRARKSAKRFSEEVFAERWVEHMERLVGLQTEMNHASR